MDAPDPQRAELVTVFDYLHKHQLDPGRKTADILERRARAIAEEAGEPPAPLAQHRRPEETALRAEAEWDAARQQLGHHEVYRTFPRFEQVHEFVKRCCLPIRVSDTETEPETLVVLYPAYKEWGGTLDKNVFSKVLDYIADVPNAKIAGAGRTKAWWVALKPKSKWKPIPQRLARRFTNFE